MPTVPTHPVIRSPSTMSPPIRSVDPDTRGTPIISPTVVMPAVYSKILATSPSSATWISEKSRIGRAPIT